MLVAVFQADQHAKGRLAEQWAGHCGTLCSQGKEGPAQKTDAYIAQSVTADPPLGVSFSQDHLFSGPGDHPLAFQTSPLPECRKEPLKSIETEWMWYHRHLLTNQENIL